MIRYEQSGGQIWSYEVKDEPEQAKPVEPPKPADPKPWEYDDDLPFS